MNIKKIFISSLRTVERSRMPQILEGEHIIRASAVSLGTFLSEKGRKKLTASDGRVRIYDIACDFFGFGVPNVNVETLEKYLESVSVSNDLTGAEISSVIEMFKLAALEKLSFFCDKYEKDNDNTEAVSQTAKLISYLSLLEKYDCADLYAKLSRCERILCRDKAYTLLDKESKDLYRHRLSVLAEKNGVS